MVIMLYGYLRVVQPYSVKLTGVTVPAQRLYFIWFLFIIVCSTTQTISELKNPSNTVTRRNLT